MIERDNHLELLQLNTQDMEKYSKERDQLKQTISNLKQLVKKIYVFLKDFFSPVREK